MSYALVNQTIASLRKEPNTNSEVVDEALYGMKVEIVEETNPDWCFVKTHYDYTGYVHRSELLFISYRIIKWDNAKKCIIKQNFADVLSKPMYQSIRKIHLTRGAVISISNYSDDNGWVKVELCNGETGYIKETFLGEIFYGEYISRNYKIGDIISCNSNALKNNTQEYSNQEHSTQEYSNKEYSTQEYSTHWSAGDENLLRRNIVKTALSYLGTQYRWGGKTPCGIDCSGLCSMVYMLNGIIIYRDAMIKEEFPIHEILLENVKPADLLYFPGHVAMYIGNGKYVHATGKNGSDGVVINSLNPDDPDYREDLPKVLKMVGSLF